MTTPIIRDKQPGGNWVFDGKEIQGFELCKYIDIFDMLDKSYNKIKSKKYKTDISRNTDYSIINITDNLEVDNQDIFNINKKINICSTLFVENKNSINNNYRPDNCSGTWCFLLLKTNFTILDLNGKKISLGININYDYIDVDSTLRKIGARAANGHTVARDITLNADTGIDYLMQKFSVMNIKMLSYYNDINISDIKKTVSKRNEAALDINNIDDAYINKNGAISALLTLQTIDPKIKPAKLLRESLILSAKRNGEQYVSKISSRG